jgi:hypothetical protein
MVKGKEAVAEKGEVGDGRLVHPPQKPVVNHQMPGRQKPAQPQTLQPGCEFEQPA